MGMFGLETIAVTAVVMLAVFKLRLCNRVRSTREVRSMTTVNTTT